MKEINREDLVISCQYSNCRVEGACHKIHTEHWHLKLKKVPGEIIPISIGKLILNVYKIFDDVPGFKKNTFSAGDNLASTLFDDKGICPIMFPDINISKINFGIGIETLAIQKDYHGQGLGQLLLNEALNKYSKDMTNIVILMAQPLQEANGKDCIYVSSEQLELSPSEANKRLKKYYKRIGFKEFSDSDYMIKIL